GDFLAGAAAVYDAERLRFARGLSWGALSDDANRFAHTYNTRLRMLGLVRKVLSSGASARNRRTQKPRKPVHSHPFTTGLNPRPPKETIRRNFFHGDNC